MANPQAGQQSMPPSWHWVGERGLHIAAGEQTLMCYQAIISRNIEEIEDVIPADGSILVILHPGAELPDALRGVLAASGENMSPVAGRRHAIPVEYGGMAGPDLSELAAQAGLDVAAYIERHAAAEYTVAFLGFQPGFPYLNGLPSELQALRRTSPRVRVEAGSVAIGGRYAGIYPSAGPGGWQIIGRTTAALFDPQDNPPTLLLPGDRLHFVPQ